MPPSREFDIPSDPQEALLHCYRAVIRDVGQYAVEIDDEVTNSHRQHLQAVAVGLAGGVDREKLAQTRSLLRNQLREYRDQAAVFLNGLRRELQAKAEALESMVNAMASADGDHEERLRCALGDLRKLAASPAAAPLRESLTAATAHIGEAIDELRRHSQLTVGQFLAEIRALHRRIESLEAAGRQDVLTGLASRLEMEARIAAEIERGAPFALVLLAIGNLPLIQRDFGATVRAGVLAAFARRLVGRLPARTLAGRWCEDQFIALVEADDSAAAELAGQLVSHLSGTYVCMEEGKPRRPSLQVAARVALAPPGCGYEALIQGMNRHS